MSMEIEKLAARVAALECRVAVKAPKKAEDKTEEKVEDKAEKKEAGERETLAAEIEALERKLSGSTLPDVTVADVQPRTAADEEKEEDKKDDEKKASLVDPSGVEEQITQKRFTEVEDLEHGTELATGDSVLDVAPTEYVARLKNASSRLDAVAEYLEKTGRQNMALRIDRIADSIDARVAKITTKKA